MLQTAADLPSGRTTSDDQVSYSLVAHTALTLSKRDLQPRENLSGQGGVEAAVKTLVLNLLAFGYGEASDVSVSLGQI